MDDRKQRTEKLSSVAAAMRRAPRLLREKSGAIAIMTVLMLPLLVGLAGIAVDVGYWYMQFRQLRAVADLAAVSAAIEIFNYDVTTLSDAQKTAVIAAAKSDAALNGVSASQITVKIPPGSGSFTADGHSATLEFDQGPDSAGAAGTLTYELNGVPQFSIDIVEGDVAAYPDDAIALN